MGLIIGDLWKAEKALWNGFAAKAVDFLTLGLVEPPDDLIFSVTAKEREEGYDAAFASSTLMATLLEMYLMGKVPGRAGNLLRRAEEAGHKAKQLEKLHEKVEKEGWTKENQEALIVILAPLPDHGLGPKTPNKPIRRPQKPGASPGKAKPASRSFPMVKGGPSCFVAGTPLLTPDGEKFIELFQPGDLILSRSEYDVDGPVEAKVVEELFVRVSPVMELVVDGRIIRTTPEHPFYVLGKGWRCAKELQEGEWLVSHEGMPVLLRKVDETNEVTTVYNLRVADYHTYFVGCQEWGFSIWAHNTCFVELHPVTDAAEIAANGGKTFKVVEGGKTLGYFESGPAAQKWWAANREIAVAGKPGSFDPADLAKHLEGTADPTSRSVIISRYLKAFQEKAADAGRTVRFGPGATTDGGFVWYGPARVGEAPVTAGGKPLRSAVYIVPDGRVYNLTVEGLTPVQQAGQPMRIKIDLEKGQAIEVK